jgi:phosphomannomutase/phosphoglucomutase
VLARLASDAKGQKVDTTDGVKIYVEGGWVLVRPSGTEQIFRVFSESTTPERAKELAERYKKQAERLIRG